MSDHAFDFLQSWIAENVNARMYGTENTVDHLAHDCVWEANTRGISKADLTEAAGGDLHAYMLAELNHALVRELENRIAQPVS
jgi:hypothetical protein